MSAIEFEAFPKIARLNRNITITEKIDGTNAAVVIVPIDESGIHFVEDSRDDEHAIFSFAWDDAEREDPIDPPVISVCDGHFILAQSRNRFITPGADNYGFAGWVATNAQALVEILGPGRHFGEWWGSGIQRGYGLKKGVKQFSLFNTARWNDIEIAAAQFSTGHIGLGVVPVLYEGIFDQAEIDERLTRLRTLGSEAAFGYNRPEGIVVYHHALRTYVKVTLEGDEAPKGAAGHALDVEKVAA